MNSIGDAQFNTPITLEVLDPEWQFETLQYVTQATRTYLKSA